MGYLVAFAILFSGIVAIIDLYYFGKRKWDTRRVYGQGSVYRIFGYNFTIRKPRSLLFMILVLFIVSFGFFL